MFRIFISTMFILSFFFTALHAKEDIFVTKYICKDLEGGKRWEAVTTIRALKEKGEGIYSLAEEGSGIYSGFKAPVRWKAEVEFFSDRTKIAPIEMKRSVFSENGSLIFEESQEFDSKKNEVRWEGNWRDSGKRTRRVFGYKGDTLNRLLLGLYMQKFLANGEREKTFSLLSSEPSMYRVTARVLDTEDITVNGSTYPAYKIYLDPETGILSPLEIILPKAYAWHLARGEFNWLKYKGVEGSVTSPSVEIETLDRLE